MSEVSSKFRGRCHKFGDDMEIDTKVMPYKYKVLYPFDAEKLVPHLFEEVTRDFYKKVNPGDFVIAGRNFACGKPHPQGFMAIAALKLVLLCESMLFSGYRGAISSGIVCHRHCVNICALVNDGDMVEMDFATGVFRNITTGASEKYAAIPPDFLAMMMLGGMKPMLKKWREKHYD